MAVIVTGAAGFIGRHVVASLVARGATVVGIDRRRWQPTPGEEAVVADLVSDAEPVAPLLREAEAVVHLAGRPGVRDRRPRADLLRWRDNVLATDTVLAHVPPSIPLVVASSSSVYGGCRHRRPSNEADPVHPRGGYARSKAEVEVRCRRRLLAGGHVAVARPFTVTGEGQRPDMAVATWIAAARDGRPLTVLGGPERTRDVTDVRDVAEGLVRMLERQVHGIVNLGTGTAHRLDEIAATVAVAMGVPLVTRTAPATADEAAATLADTRRCTEVLGLTPRTDLAGLVARQIAAVPSPTVLAEAV